MGRLSIGTRLAGGSLAVVALIVVLGLVALEGLDFVSAHYGEALQVYSTRAIAGLQLKAAVLEQVKAQKNYLLRGEPTYLREVREQGHLVHSAREELQAAALTDSDRALLRRLDLALEDLTRGFEAEIGARQAHGIEAADRLTRGKATAVVAVLDEIVARARAHAALESRDAQRHSQRTRSLTVALIAVIAVTALGLGLALSLSVGLPLRRLRSQIDAIAREGAAQGESAARSGDEIAQLARALNDMVQRLALLRDTEARSRRLEAFSSRVAQAQEEERERIAHELHDGIGQALTAIKLDLAGAARGLAAEATDAQQYLSKAQRLADESLDELRRLSFDLRPAALDHLGLVAALESYVRSFKERSRIGVTIESDTLDPRLPFAMETALYRICQEALTNISKHAEATEAVVNLKRGTQTVTLTVSDNGKGFDTTEVTSADGVLRGIGLIGMERRAEELGGSLAIESRSGEGTTVRAELPWHPPKEV